MIAGSTALGAGFPGEGSQLAVLAVDESGNARHGTYVGNVGIGAPSLLDNDPNTASYFDTATDFVYVGDDAAFSFASNNFAFELWFKPDLTVSYEALLGKRGNPWEYSIYRSGSTLQFNAWNPIGIIVYSTGYTLPDLAKHYYVWQANGTSANLYVDAILQTTVAKTVGIDMADTASPLLLAAGGGLTGGFVHGALEGAANLISGLAATLRAAWTLNGLVNNVMQLILQGDITTVTRPVPPFLKAPRESQATLREPTRPSFILSGLYVPPTLQASLMMIAIIEGSLGLANPQGPWTVRANKAHQANRAAPERGKRSTVLMRG